jgi:acyl-CoA thioester hydrolase
MTSIVMNNRKALTYRNVIMPWQCDQNGHLNTRFYMEVFDSAAGALLSMLGHSMAIAKSSGFGWVDAHQEISYLTELRDGEMVTVWTGVEGLGTTSIKYFHEVYAEDRDAPSALCKAVMVHFDLTKRAKTTLPPAFRAAAAPFLAG